MFVAVTQGIKVTVTTQYQSLYSRPFQDAYAFSYKVKIENQSDYTIQLLRRHWHIIDVNGMHHEVEGEGVVGLQPIIEPGKSHEYISGCNIDAPIGKMYGTYLMEKTANGRFFEVEIPEFTLIAPFLLN